MAFPIIPRRRSAATGNPTSLNLGELAVNTLTGELFLGADGGVTLLNGPVAAGTTVTEHTGDGTTVAFTFGGYNGTADGGYIVSVGGIDQPPSKYSISNTAGGTITFVDAPVDGELISIRAMVAGSGGGSSGNATSLQGVPISIIPPLSGEGLVYDGTQWFAGGIGNATSIKSYPIADSYTPANGDFLNFNNGEWTGTGINTGNATSLQNAPISTTSPDTGYLLRFDGNQWAPFDGVGIQNWNASQSYVLGDKVYYQGLIYSNRGTYTSTNPAADPANWDQASGGSNSPGPTDPVNVAYWMRINFEGAWSYIPVYR
jgi:hypothetical protein